MSNASAEGIGFLDPIPVAASLVIVAEIRLARPAAPVLVARCDSRVGVTFLSANERGNVHCIEMLPQVVTKWRRPAIEQTGLSLNFFYVYM
jgi:hypothetical protein